MFADFASRPIPPIRPPEGWKDVPIVECGEPLVAISSLQHPRIQVEPEYYLQQIPTAVEEMYLRTGAAARLLQAVDHLPEHLCLLIWDGWRPLTVQQAIFDAQYQVFQQQEPSLTDDELRSRTETYVSVPSADPRRPSPHSTGGAIDLTLVGSDGHSVHMGTEFDGFGPPCRTRFLEERLEHGEHLTEEESAWLRHRRLLYHAMIGAGFTNYWEEWWHYDYGNQFWGAVSSAQPIYSGVEKALI
jgi:zinc D-Ala-D-Ala dipeptidase